MSEPQRDSPSRIFISYRRDDAAGDARSLAQPLCDRFGEGRVVRDTDSIPPGVDFVKVLEQQLEGCAVMLLVIGPQWLTVQDPRLKTRRLDNENDYLRLEVATALKNERVLVVPVLVQGAAMPAAEDLPPDLKPLSTLNAVELRDSRWKDDVDDLISKLEAALDPAPPRLPLEDETEPIAVESGTVAVPKEEPAGFEMIEASRQRELAEQLATARHAFDAEDFDAVLAACAEAIWIDPKSPEALDLARRARAALTNQQIEERLAQARKALAAGQLTAASDFTDQGEDDIPHEFASPADDPGKQPDARRLSNLLLRPLSMLGVGLRQLVRWRRASVDAGGALPQPVLLGVSAPRTVQPGQTFSSQFVAYIQQFEDAVRRQLIEIADSPAQTHTLLGLPPSGSSRWTVGTPVSVHVSGDHLVAQPASSAFTWNGERNIVSFLVTVDPAGPPSTIHLCCEAFIGPVSIAFVPIPITIALGPCDPSPKTVQSRPFATAFASYASADAAQVALGLSWLKRWDVGLEIFLDCLDLTPNETWQHELEAVIPTKDVFLLFWSVNAMKSPWVRWELQIACRAKAQSAIRAMPLDDPSIAPPPAELKHIQFRDRYLFARQAFLQLAEHKKQGDVAPRSVS